MYGAILGDIVGSPYEFDRGEKRKDFGPLFIDASEFTDDTVMTIAVAEGLMKAGLDASVDQIKKEVIKSMKYWGRKYPDAGYGGRFARWLFSDNDEPYGSYGNGSAMRVSSAGWLYDGLERTREVARATAEVTHNHPEGIKGAEVTASAIFLARIGKSKDEIKQYIIDEFGYDLSRTLDEIRPGYYHVESCQGTVPEAITAFLESTDFEDCIRNAVSLGGDCDTLTCIAGGIAEAFYSVPDELEEGCNKRLPEKFIDILFRFNMFFKKITIPRKLSEMDEEQFVEYVANDCISRLSEKDKQTLRENPDPIALHFGYGMYIRNHYIHGKRLKFMCLSSDDLSADIIERIIAKLGYKDESKVERI